MSHSRPVQVPLKLNTCIGCFPALLQPEQCERFKTGGGTLSLALMYFENFGRLLPVPLEGSVLAPLREEVDGGATQLHLVPGCHGGSAWRQHVRGEYMVPNRGSHPTLNPTSQ